MSAKGDSVTFDFVKGVEKTKGAGAALINPQGLNRARNPNPGSRITIPDRAS
jgi:hypothetical protein